MECGNPSSNLTIENQEFASGSPPASFRFGDLIGVKCINEYEYPDGSSSKTISCTAGGSWTQILQCQLKSMNNYNFKNNGF